MVNRCKNPEIYAVARSELNSWVRYLVYLISNRFLSYKTHIWNRVRAKINDKPWRQPGGLRGDCLHYATDASRNYIGPTTISIELSELLSVGLICFLSLNFLNFHWAVHTVIHRILSHFFFSILQVLRIVFFISILSVLWKITILSLLACKSPLTNWNMFTTGFKSVRIDIMSWSILHWLHQVRCWKLVMLAKPLSSWLAPCSE